MEQYLISLGILIVFIMFLSKGYKAHKKALERLRSKNDI